MLVEMQRPVASKVLGRPRVYPLPEMEPGDSFEVEYGKERPDKVYLRVRTSIVRWGRQNNRKFNVERRDNGVYVERLKE